MKNTTPQYVLLSIFLIALLACKNKPETMPPAPTLPFPVITISQQDLTSFESFPTAIEGEVNSDIRPKVSGYINKVLTHEGENVKKGQLLFKLETQALTQQAEAGKANVNAAKVEVDKLKPLVAKNIISEVQLETAKAQLLQAKSNYNSIVANINYANITSPVNGVVGTINYREGALVSAQDPLPITNVSSIQNVYAYFSMNEKAFINFMETTTGNTLEEKIKTLPKVSLILANGSTYNKPGTIETIAGNINQQTGTVSFRAKFNNDEGLLRNGSSGTLLVPKQYNDQIIIPAESTFERQGNVFVYTVQADSLVATPINILADADKAYVVESGLNVGQTILAKGVNKLSEGSKIKPVPTPIDSILNSYKTVFK